MGNDERTPSVKAITSSLHNQGWYILSYRKDSQVEAVGNRRACRTRCLGGGRIADQLGVVGVPYGREDIRGD